MDPEKIFKEHLKGKQAADDSKFLAAVSLVAVTGAKELADASTLLAEKTQESAELLAKTTQASADRLSKSNQASAELLAERTQESAELLAKTTQESAQLLAETTQESADRLSKNNTLSVRLMERLNVSMLIIGLIQVLIAAMAIFISLQVTR